MSMRVSLTYKELTFSIHRFVHAAQPWKERPIVFWEIGIGRWSWQIWPWTMTYENNPWWNGKGVKR